MSGLVAMLLQALGEMLSDKRQRMELFIKLLADRNECVLSLIWRIESRMLEPPEGFTALDACIQAMH